MSTYDASTVTTPHESPPEALQRLARQRGISLEAIADELGLSFYSLRNRLNGRYPFRKLEAEKLARMFHVSIETFLPTPEAQSA